MTAPQPSELRRYERFRLEPMYTSVTVQRVEGMKLQTIEGHAYDISEAGARIELDEALPVGERIGLCLRLPGESRSIFASGRVVWVHDAEDDPGPRRMAVEFTRFLGAEDQSRLMRHVGPRAAPRAA